MWCIPQVDGEYVVRMENVLYDCEHKRNGAVNLFVFLDAHLLAQSQSDRQPNCRRICHLDARPY